MLPTQHGEDTDESLYARVARGDRAAFARLVGRHRGRLGAVVTRMTGQAAAAEDIVQEAFVRAWVQAPGWRGPEDGGTARFATWLTRIALNLAIDRARRVAPVALDVIAEPEAGDPDGEALLLQRERATLLARAVAALPDRQRAAITLTYDDDLPNAEAAAVLGTTVGAFELLLVRARRTLRQALQDA
jgi:RNA polymerase sigma-70 factor (ECF subfamily)